MRSHPRLDRGAARPTLARDLIAAEEDVLVLEDGGDLLEELCEKGVRRGFGWVHRVLARAFRMR